MSAMQRQTVQCIVGKRGRGDLLVTCHDGGRSRSYLQFSIQDYKAKYGQLALSLSEGVVMFYQVGMFNKGYS